MVNNIVLSSLKTKIHQVAPDAKIMLFGSRAYGIPTEESDWDILILTPQIVTTAVRNRLHDHIFPLSVQIGAFINTMVIQEEEWINNPSYYSLHQTIDKKMVQL